MAESTEIEPCQPNVSTPLHQGAEMPTIQTIRSDVVIFGMPTRNARNLIISAKIRIRLTRLKRVASAAVANLRSPGDTRGNLLHHLASKLSGAPPTFRRLKSTSRDVLEELGRTKSERRSFLKSVEGLVSVCLHQCPSVLVSLQRPSVLCLLCRCHRVDLGSSAQTRNAAPT